MKQFLWKRILFLTLSLMLVLGTALYANHPPCGVLTFPDDTDAIYRSLADALVANGYSAAHLPVWIPEDFSIIRVDDKSNSKMHRLKADYESPRGVLQLSALITSNNTVSVMEKDSGGYQMTHNGIEIYVYTNGGDHRATWFADDILFTFSAAPASPGAITEREFLAILQSIPK